MALIRLNLLAKQLQTPSDNFPGMKIHSRQRVTLALAKGQQTYTIGPAATDSRASTLMGRTTVLTNYASGTSLAVSSVTDTTTYPGTTISMTSADFIGVQLDDGTIGWTTLNGTPSSSPATLTAGFSVAAAAGNYVYWFTSRAQRIPFIEAAVLRQPERTDSELPIYREVREYDLGVSNKYAAGTPTAILVEPLRLNTRITLNTQPTEVTQQIVLTGLYPAEDYDSASNDLAFPQEAYAYISWALAKRCASAKGVQWTQLMESNYMDAKSMYMNLNPENSVLYFQSGT